MSSVCGSMQKSMELMTAMCTVVRICASYYFCIYWIDKIINWRDAATYLDAALEVLKLNSQFCGITMAKDWAPSKWLFLPAISP